MIPSNYRKFDGKRFELWDTLPRTKYEAQKKAEGFRKKGGQARIVKHPKSGYSIYIRGK